MNRRLVLLASVLVLSGCSLVMREEQPWAFVTSVGGLELGVPVLEKNRWKLPIRADVSGLQSITVEPTLRNSGLVCEKTKAYVQGRKIVILIVTTIPHGDANPVCTAADLGAIRPGQYEVFYGTRYLLLYDAKVGERTLLGSIRIGH